jgi:hypothetical protein
MSVTPLTRESNTGVAHYDTGVRLVFTHGRPDGNSHYAVADLHVVQTTQQHIDSSAGIRSQAHPRMGTLIAERVMQK